MDPRGLRAFCQRDDKPPHQFKFQLELLSIHTTSLTIQFYYIDDCESNNNVVFHDYFIVYAKPQ